MKNRMYYYINAIKNAKKNTINNDMKKSKKNTIYNSDMKKVKKNIIHNDDMKNAKKNIRIMQRKIQ